MGKGAAVLACEFVRVVDEGTAALCGCTVENGSPEAVPSIAAPRKLYRREQTHRRPYHREQLPGGCAVESGFPDKTIYELSSAKRRPNLIHNGSTLYLLLANVSDVTIEGERGRQEAQQMTTRLPEVTGEALHGWVSDSRDHNTLLEGRHHFRVRVPEKSRRERDDRVLPVGKCHQQHNVDTDTGKRHSKHPSSTPIEALVLQLSSVTRNIYQ
ncbi:hypothetical protein LSAT2_012251 [Lamellibrachia satsuma]|nr:hypothetical protein LSAT2_012251 [Lamellibrachia satsuma]